MIIMRALVATVLLITVVLVSIVLINANSRHERSSVTITRSDGSETMAEVDETEMKVMTSSSYEEDPRMGLNPEEDRKTFEYEETLTEKVKHSKDSTLINAIRKAGTTSEDDIVETVSKVEVIQSEPEVLEDTEVEENVELHNIDATQIDEDAMVDEKAAVDSKSTDYYVQVTRSSSTANVPITEGDYYVDDAPVEEPTFDKLEPEEPAGKYFEARTLNDIKARSKENQWLSRKSSSTTDRQTPLGYEPESYIVVDEDMFKSTRTKLEDDFVERDDLLASSSISSRPLERKQRAVFGNPETIVLNKAPIVPQLEDDYREPGCPHMFPPPPPPPQPSYMERGVNPGYPGMTAFYNPHNWHMHSMNHLRFPQCAACQRKQVPLCRTCGKCSECCIHSGCTCGCLHS